MAEDLSQSLSAQAPRSEPVSRLYYAVILASGQRLILSKNLIANCWYRQSY